jgi:hypothetical protein
MTVSKASIHVFSRCVPPSGLESGCVALVDFRLAICTNQLHDSPRHWCFRSFVSLLPRIRHAQVVLAEAGVENVNAQVDELITTGVLRRVLAFTELKFSNSMIEAWWRSLKHQWLFLHSLDSVTTLRRLVAFYVQEHNRVLPHSAFRGQTPDEMYFGRGDGVPADLTARAAAARRARIEANRSAACGRCRSIHAAA